MFKPVFKESKTGKNIIGNNTPEKLCGYQYGFFNNSSIWNIPHNAESKLFLSAVIIGNKIIDNYDLTIIDNNNIQINFSQPTNGIVNLLIYTNNEICVTPFAITPTPSVTATITPTITPTRTPQITLSVTPSITPSIIHHP